ncbi:hypothetical protein N8851_05440 [Schleiferiaceae bacterium]|nr:hypothetical protein [Schleiferiaceae bacterium]
MIKQISILSFGGVIVTLLQIFLYPIFASRTGSEILGDYGYILSLLQTVALVILLNTQLLIRVAKHQMAIAGAINLGVTLLLLFSLPLGLLFFEYPIEIIVLNILIFACLGIKHLSLSVLYNEERYAVISAVNVLGKTIAIFFLIGITFLVEIRLTYLLIVSLLSEIIVIVTILSNMRENSFRPKVSFNVEIFKTHKDIVGYKSAQDFINRMGGQLPIIFARNFVDTATAGNYFLALKMIQSPLSILSKSVREVVFVEYGKIKSSVENKFARKFVLIHIILSVILCATLLILNDLLSDILSEEWILSFRFLFYVIPMLLSNSLASVFRDNLLILKEGKYILKLDAIFGLLRLLAFILCWKLNIDFMSYLMVMVIMTVVFNLFPMLKWKYYC